MTGSSLLYAAIGVAGVAILGAQLRAPESEQPPVPTRRVAAPSSAATVATPLGGVSLPRAPDNHFYAEAQVNGARVRFLVDTGASSVVLTREDALRAGIGTGDYSARGIGAGGEVRLMPTTLARLALGTIAADNVPAMVAEDGLPVSLLGQSFLSRIGTVAIEGDDMVLR